MTMAEPITIDLESGSYSLSEPHMMKLMKKEIDNRINKKTVIYFVFSLNLSGKYLKICAKIICIFYCSFF